MGFKAIGFRVLVDPVAVQEKTKSGIVLALDEKLERGATQCGTVVAIGPEAFRAFNRNAGFNTYVPWVHVGDTVYFAKYSGKWLTHPHTGKDYLMINDEDLCSGWEDDVAA